MTIQRRRILQAGVVGAVLGVAGCVTAPGGDESATDDDGDQSDQGGGVGDGELVVATTTSTDDTGLLDELNAAFEASFGITVKAIPKGTGASIRTAEDGDADVVLVHARSAEDAFLRDGYGVNRRDVMYNDFVVVGPADDPADIAGTGSATDAFGSIADTESTFVSRGDDSGTNMKELAVWDAAGVDPGGTWYREIGKGMGDTLVQASESGAYTLADRGTFRSMETEIDLEIQVQGPLDGGPELLKNPYGVIPVDPATHGNVNYQAAMAYVGFLTSPDGQAIIENYEVNGSQLFHPSASSQEPNFGQYVPVDVDGEELERTRHAIQTPAPTLTPDTDVGKPDDAPVARQPDGSSFDERSVDRTSGDQPEQEAD